MFVLINIRFFMFDWGVFNLLLFFLFLRFGESGATAES